MKYKVSLRIMNNVANRIIDLYDLDTRGNIKKLSDRMGISHTAVKNYKYCETPPQKLIQQISKDFDGKEGRSLISWDWLFTGIGDKFKNIDDLPPEPPKPKEDKITLESLKEIFLDRFLKMESEIKELKSSQFNDRMTISGIGVEIQGIKENINLGKLNTNTKVSENIPNVVDYYPNRVNKLSKLG